MIFYAEVMLSVTEEKLEQNKLNKILIMTDYFWQPYDHHGITDEVVDSETSDEGVRRGCNFSHDLSPSVSSNFRGIWAVDCLEVSIQNRWIGTKTFVFV